MPKTGLTTKLVWYNQRETGYGTGVSTLPFLVGATDGNFINEETENVDNVNQMGFSDFPTEARVVGQKSQLDGEILWMRTKELAFLLGAWASKVTTKTPTSATLGKEHLIVPDGANLELHTFSQAMEFYTGERAKYDGCWLDSVTIQASGDQADRDLHGSFSIMGETESSLSALPTAAFNDEGPILSLINAGLYFSKTVFDSSSHLPVNALSAGTLDSSINITEAVNEISMTFNNNSLNGFRPGSKTLARALRGQRSIELSLNFEEGALIDLIAGAREEKFFSFQVAIQGPLVEASGPNYGVMLTFPKIQPVMAPRSLRDSIIDVNPTWKVLQPAGAEAFYCHVYDKSATVLAA